MDKPQSHLETELADAEGRTAVRTCKDLSQKVVVNTPNFNSKAALLATSFSEPAFLSCFILFILFNCNVSPRNYITCRNPPAMCLFFLVGT